MTTSPLVSVVMPVYNTERYVAQAIQSILHQSLADLEFIILDDGSTDRSADIILSYKDPRIIFLRNEQNIGNYPTRNKGMRQAKGKYIAVMDADDIAHSTRLAKETEYLENHADTGIVSSWVYLSNGNVLKRPQTHNELKLLLLKCNCIPHPPMMIRKEALEQFNWYYNENYKYSADYELVTRAIFQTNIHILPEPLLWYRIHPDQISTAKRKEQWNYAEKVRQIYTPKLKQEMHFNS